MPPKVLLPASQRRLRHVDFIALRNLPLAPAPDVALTYAAMQRAGLPSTTTGLNDLGATPTTGNPSVDINECRSGEFHRKDSHISQTSPPNEGEETNVTGQRARAATATSDTSAVSATADSSEKEQSAAAPATNVEGADTTTTESYGTNSHPASGHASLAATTSDLRGPGSHPLRLSPGSPNAAPGSPPLERAASASLLPTAAMSGASTNENRQSAERPATSATTTGPVRKARARGMTVKKALERRDAYASGPGPVALDALQSAQGSTNSFVVSSQQSSASFPASFAAPPSTAVTSGSAPARTAAESPPPSVPEQPGSEPAGPTLTGADDDRRPSQSDVLSLQSSHRASAAKDTVDVATAVSQKNDGTEDNQGQCETKEEKEKEEKEKEEEANSPSFAQKTASPSPFPEGADAAAAARETTVPIAKSDVADQPTPPNEMAENEREEREGSNDGQMASSVKVPVPEADMSQSGGWDVVTSQATEAEAASRQGKNAGEAECEGSPTDENERPSIPTNRRVSLPTAAQHLAQGDDTVPQSNSATKEGSKDGATGSTEAAMPAFDGSATDAVSLPPLSTGIASLSTHPHQGRRGMSPHRRGGPSTRLDMSPVRGEVITTGEAASTAFGPVISGEVHAAPASASTSAAAAIENAPMPSSTPTPAVHKGDVIYGQTVASDAPNPTQGPQRAQQSPFAQPSAQQQQQVRQFQQSRMAGYLGYPQTSRLPSTFIELRDALTDVVAYRTEPVFSTRHPTFAPLSPDVKSSLLSPIMRLMVWRVPQDVTEDDVCDDETILDEIIRYEELRVAAAAAKFDLATATPLQGTAGGAGVDITVAAPASPTPVELPLAAIPVVGDTLSGGKRTPAASPAAPPVVSRSHSDLNIAGAPTGTTPRVQSTTPSKPATAISSPTGQHGSSLPKSPMADRQLSDTNGNLRPTMGEPSMSVGSLGVPGAATPRGKSPRAQPASPFSAPTLRMSPDPGMVSSQRMPSVPTADGAGPTGTGTTTANASPIAAALQDSLLVSDVLLDMRSLHWRGADEKQRKRDAPPSFVFHCGSDVFTADLQEIIKVQPGLRQLVAKYKATQMASSSFVASSSRHDQDQALEEASERFASNTSTRGKASPRQRALSMIRASSFQVSSTRGGCVAASPRKFRSKTACSPAPEEEQDAGATAAADVDNCSVMTASPSAAAAVSNRGQRHFVDPNEENAANKNDEGKQNENGVAARQKDSTHGKDAAAGRSMLQGLSPGIRTTSVILETEELDSRAVFEMQNGETSTSTSRLLALNHDDPAAPTTKSPLESGSLSGETPTKGGSSVPALNTMLDAPLSKMDRGNSDVESSSALAKTVGGSANGESQKASSPHLSDSANGSAAVSASPSAARLMDSVGPRSASSPSKRMNDMNDDDDDDENVLGESEAVTEQRFALNRTGSMLKAAKFRSKSMKDTHSSMLGSAGPSASFDPNGLDSTARSGTLDSKALGDAEAAAAAAVAATMEAIPTLQDDTWFMVEDSDTAPMPSATTVTATDTVELSAADATYHFMVAALTHQAAMEREDATAALIARVEEAEEAASVAQLSAECDELSELLEAKRRALDRRRAALGTKHIALSEHRAKLAQNTAMIAESTSATTSVSVPPPARLAAASTSEQRPGSTETKPTVTNVSSLSNVGNGSGLLSPPAPVRRVRTASDIEVDDNGSAATLAPDAASAKRLVLESSAEVDRQSRSKTFTSGDGPSSSKKSGSGLEAVSSSSSSSGSDTSMGVTVRAEADFFISITKVHCAHIVKEMVTRYAKHTETGGRHNFGTTLGFSLPSGPTGEPETEEHFLAYGAVALLLFAVSKLHEVELPHPVFPAHSRSYLIEYAGSTRQLPLYVQRSADRPLTQRAVQLLRADIMHVAYAIHKHKHADGLPIATHLHKLLTGR